MRFAQYLFTLFTLLIGFLALVSASSHHDLVKRQAAAGGGGGAPTTYTGLQTISGYNPPPPSAYPQPTVAAGTILSLSQIPGYNSSKTLDGSGNSGAGSSGISGSGSGSSQLQDYLASSLLTITVASVLGLVIL